MTWVGFTRGVRDRLRGLAEGSNAPLKLILAASEPLDKDIVGQWTRSQTAQTSSNDVGAKHSGDKIRNLIKIFLSECFALSH